MVIFCVLLGVSFTWTPTKWFFLSRPSPDREAIRAELISSGVLGADAYVIVAGPANVYGHYVTTREEYAVQRYEGASTIFGQCECCYLRRAVICVAKRFIFLENVTVLNMVASYLKLPCLLFFVIWWMSSRLRTFGIWTYPLSFAQ